MATQGTEAIGDSVRSLECLVEIVEGTEAKPQSPWPFLDEWVKYKEMVGDNYIFQCLSCLPKVTEVKVNRGTKANLKSHFKRIHPSKAKIVDQVCKANAGTGGRSGSRTLSSQAEGGLARKIQPPVFLADAAFKAGEAVKAGAVTGGKRIPLSPSHRGSARKKQRQMFITDGFGMKALDGSSTSPLYTLDEAVVSFVVENMLPLQIVDTVSFKGLVHSLNPNAAAPSSSTLATHILNTFQDLKKSLTSKLEQVHWVSSTADCWSAKKEWHLCMSVHWLEPHTRLRRMAVLACTRVMGSHSYQGLANTMNNIHSHFGIDGKVTMTTTDNLANLKKTFAQISSNLDEEQEEETHTAGADAERADTQLLELCADPSDVQGTLELEFMALDEMKNSSDYSLKLPRQHRCEAHTLSLAATTALEERHTSQAFMTAYRTTMAKAQALWNKLRRNKVFADNLYKAIQRRLPIPSQAKWGSLCDSLVALNKVLQEKQDVMNAYIVQHGDLTLFTQTDIDFMSEYATVMRVVAEAVDKIQGEQQWFLGFLIPTLTVARRKLARLMASGGLQVCKPLANTLLSAMDSRLARTTEDEECLMATAFHPKFRLKWMDASEETRISRPDVQAMMERKVEEFLRRADLYTTNSSKMDDYFASVCDEGDDPCGGQQRSSKVRAAHIVDVWLQTKSTDSLADPAFNSEKVLIDLFLRYNTALPSGAAVERLFCLNKDIARAERSSLSDDNFNMLMFLKGNMLQDFT